MTYPKTNLTRPMRRGIMFFLIALFFVVSPLIILYTAGYRYNLPDFQVMQTGVISIDVEPHDAQVYLSGVLIEKRIPIRLPNRAPGTYHLRIQKTGYKTWERDIVVESKQTTYVRDIALFKDASPTEVIADPAGTITDISLSPNGKYALFVKYVDQIHELNLFSTADNSTTPLTRSYGNIAPEIDWSPFSPYVLIQTTDGNSTKVQLLDASNPEQQSETYRFATSEPIVFQWDESSAKPSIFVGVNSTIYELTPTERRALPSNVPSSIWYVLEGQVWYLNPFDNTIQLQQDGKKQSIPVEGKLDRIIHMNDRRLIVASDQEILVLLQGDKKNSQKKRIPVGNVIFNSGTSEWIAWSPWELWSIFPSGETFLLNRTSEAVGSVSPLDEYGLLLFSTDTTLHGFNPGYFVTHELFSGGKIRDVVVNMAERQIYFWGEVSERQGLFGLEY